MAAYSELYIEQCADFSTTINIDDSQGDAINLSGYHFSSQMRKSYYSNIHYDFSIDINNPSRGEITLSMAAIDTSNINPGRYVYDLTMTDTSNTITRVVEGIVVVLPGVTKNG